jgi:serine/threonine protein kinase
MGEVFRARDTRLGRDVAVKILPEAFAQEEDRMRRFEQEARAVAAVLRICVADTLPGRRGPRLCLGGRLNSPQRSIRLSSLWGYGSRTRAFAKLF